MNQLPSSATNHLEVMDFFEKVLKDEVLLEEFIAALGEKDSAAISKVAGERGYDLTPEKLQQGLSHIKNLIAPYVFENK